MKTLKRILESPYLRLCLGLLLLGTSLADAWDTLATDLRNFDLSSHHSIGLFGLFYALRSLLEVLEHATRAADEMNEAKRPAESDNPGTEAPI